MKEVARKVGFTHRRGERPVAFRPQPFVKTHFELLFRKARPSLSLSLSPPAPIASVRCTNKEKWEDRVRKRVALVLVILWAQEQVEHLVALVILVALALQDLLVEVEEVEEEEGQSLRKAEVVLISHPRQMHHLPMVMQIS